jgi:hypothetical protein
MHCSKRMESWRVLALLQKLPQDWHKADSELEAHLRDVCFAVDDEVLLDTEHVPPRCSCHDVLAPSRSSRARHPTLTYSLDVPASASKAPRAAPPSNSTSNVNASTCSGPQVETRPQLWQRRQRRSCSSSGCVTAARRMPECWCAGWAATRPATRGRRRCSG